MSYWLTDLVRSWNQPSELQSTNVDPVNILIHSPNNVFKGSFCCAPFYKLCRCFIKKKKKEKQNICLRKNVNMNFNISQEMCALQQQGLKLTDDHYTAGAK